MCHCNSCGDEAASPAPAPASYAVVTVAASVADNPAVCALAPKSVATPTADVVPVCAEYHANFPLASTSLSTKKRAPIKRTSKAGNKIAAGATSSDQESPAASLNGTVKLPEVMYPLFATPTTALKCKIVLFARYMLPASSKLILLILFF